MSRPASFSLKEYFPLLLALVATFIPVWLLERSILSATGGVFMYPLDDPFIHMQVARNLALHQTWGINPGEFGSASSSILYTLLLSGVFKVFGVQVAAPFVVNCVAVVFLLAVADGWLRKQGLKDMARTIVLLLVVFLTPLPTLIISGMEHTLQCLFAFLFITRFSDWLGGRGRLSAGLCIYAILLVGIRYEGLFLVFVACLMLLNQRRLGPAILLGAAALAPVILFGMWSLTKGSYFLPNSVLVKSEGIPFSLHGMTEWLNNTLVNKFTLVKAQPGLIGSPPPGISLLATQRLLLILPLVYLVFKGSMKGAYKYFLILLTAGVLLHLAFAATGWFYRYEAYLIFLATLILCVLVVKYGAGVLQGGRLWALLLGFALLFPWLLRSTAAYAKAKQACLNIYDQQYQMGRFLKTYHDKDTVAANDIGAIGYQTNARVVDLWGLGSIDVARSRKGGYWTPAFLDSLTHAQKVKLAIVFDEWFDPALLHKWTRVASWQISDNVICGSDVVVFYAPDKIEAPVLQQELKDFEKELPAGTKATYQPL